MRLRRPLCLRRAPAAACNAPAYGASAYGAPAYGGRADALVPRARTLFAALGALFLCVAGPAATQGIDLSRITAADEFRWGVVSLNQGRISEAIASLNRSLSFNPDDAVVRYWLGRAYYYAGFEDAALQEWRWISERFGRTTMLDKWIERTQLSRGLTAERLGDEPAPGRYVTMTSVAGVTGEVTIFRRPTSVRPRADGRFYVVSFGDQSVVLLDPNGGRRQVIDGGIEGLDRPFDLVQLSDGSLLVSEFASDRIARISPLGLKVGSFGSQGRGGGGLLGPQYLALSGDHLYVSDYGNSRIAKYTVDGEFLFAFGTRTRHFSGLRSPAGVVVENDRVYVADSELAAIFVFDTSGNYLERLDAPPLTRPEGLSLYSPGRLLVTNGHQLQVLDVETGVVSVIGELATRQRIMGAAVDANGNLVAADYQTETVVIMAASEELYTGLNVEIGPVISTNHPEVFATVTVTDRSGRPMLGLDASNFRVTEDRFPTGPADVVYAGWESFERSVALVVDRYRGMEQDRAQIEQAALDVMGRLANADLGWVISSGAEPVMEADPTEGLLQKAAGAVGSAPDYGSGSLDLALRLAGAQLIETRGRRAIVAVSNGTIDPGAFDRFTLAETGRFLVNNRILMSVIYTQRNVRAGELDYLADLTGGSSLYVYQPEGAGAVVDGLASQPSGTYVLRYQSVHGTDFGRRYIPLEVEAYLLGRSGRDEAGYYGRLEF